jgi:hypothetical protein
MTEAPPPGLRTSARRLASLRFVAAEGIGLRIVVAVFLSLICAAALVALSGHNPLSAFAAIAMGAAGSPHQFGVALNRATPYLLADQGRLLLPALASSTSAPKARSRSAARRGGGRLSGQLLDAVRSLPLR